MEILGWRNFVLDQPLALKGKLERLADGAELLARDSTHAKVTALRVEVTVLLSGYRDPLARRMHARLDGAH